MFFWRYVRTSGSYLLILFLILYVAYFTSEVCLRIQNLNKYERLQNYETEVNELANKLTEFRKDSRNVKKSLGLLRDVLKDIIEIHKSNNNPALENSSIHNSLSNKNYRKNVKQHYKNVHRLKSKDYNSVR